MNMRLTMLALAMGCLALQPARAANPGDAPSDDLDALSLADKAPEVIAGPESDHVDRMVEAVQS